MSFIEVQGLQPLKGEIKIQGSKNAVLPMMAASLLHKGVTRILHVPEIKDVSCMLDILSRLGCVCCLEEGELTIDASQINATVIQKDDMNRMRSSIVVLGALLGRAGEASAHTPGGCSIGSRPIDFHLYALRSLGAEIWEDETGLHAHAACLQGAEIYFPLPSVGATENALLAAVRAEGVTRIHGASREPEIIELCRFLNQMGSQIKGIGTDLLEVEGGRCLHDCCYRVAGDRIVAGTYLSAVMAIGGSIELTGINYRYMEFVLRQAQKMGAEITPSLDWVRVTVDGRPKPCKIRTAPYPGFPTDLQSPMMAVLSVADGKSEIEETVFEGRYGTAGELAHMGAEITVEGRMAYIVGKRCLKGSQVRARDLRCGAALVVAALAAEGTTRIEDPFHITRGYEDICRDLRQTGAMISFV